MFEISDNAVVAESGSAPAEINHNHELEPAENAQPVLVTEPTNFPATEAGINPTTEEAPATEAVVPDSAEPVQNGPDDSAQTPIRPQDEAASAHNNPGGGDATPDSGSDATKPVNHEPTPTETALALVEPGNGIDRFPYDSVVVDKGSEWFAHALLDQLYALWDNGAEAYLLSYRKRCEIVYWIHKKTAKPGCGGEFRAAMRRIGLAYSTGYDMVRCHAISIGEAKDPDADDSRDEVAEQSGKTENGGAGHVADPPKTNPNPRYPKVVLTLKGEFAEAVAGIKSSHNFPDSKQAIEECVLLVWRKLQERAARGTDRKQVRAEVVNESAAA